MNLGWSLEFLNRPYEFLNSWWWWSRDGAVVRALAFRQCGSGSIPGLDIICGLSLLLVVYSAPRGFSLGTPVFPYPQKPTLVNSIWSGMLERLIHEPLAWEIGQPLLILSSLNKFDLFFMVMLLMMMMMIMIGFEYQPLLKLSHPVECPSIRYKHPLVKVTCSNILYPSLLETSPCDVRLVSCIWT